jgi:hypothetical protein
MRTITYVVATENGRYNPTFPWGRIQAYLDFMSNYFPIRFVRISDWNSARYRIVNGNYTSTVTAALTSASNRTTRISNTFNFGMNDYWSAKVIMHEFGHCLNTSIVHLSGNVDIMTPSAGTAGNFTKRDCDNFYARAYGYLGTRRPWNEPDAMRQAFTPVRALGLLSSPEIADEISCSCKIEATPAQTYLGWLPGFAKRTFGLIP